MQDWADRLDLLEQGQVAAASTALTITLQGLPTIAGQTAGAPSECAATGGRRQPGRARVADDGAATVGGRCVASRI